MEHETLGQVVARARLAPSVHNVQPARWRLAGGQIEIGCDPALTLAVADPEGFSAGLSCGAAVEATVLALSAFDLAGDVTNLWPENDCETWQGVRLVARIAVSDGKPLPLVDQLERRFTWRGPFAGDTPQLYGWTRKDTQLVMDVPTRDWLADLNDRASFEIMQGSPFRRELLSWMRLRDGHPRAAYDGLSRQALGMGRAQAHLVPLALGPLWPVMNTLGRARGLTAEAEMTRTAPVIACFHRPAAESPVETGRAYLRLCLEATHLGFAGWPMAALSDHPVTREEIGERLAIDPDDRLVQVIRFGVPMGDPPPRARRPLSELIP
jgi:nitroreductase